MMVPVGRLVLLRSVPKADLVGAMAWLTVPALIGPVIGPPLGGFITTYFHWRWIFWINVPIGDPRHGPGHPVHPGRARAGRAAFDRRASLLSRLGLVGSDVRLRDDRPRHRARLGRALLLCLGRRLLLLFVLHARRVAHPVLDLRLLRMRTFRASRHRRLPVPDGHRRHAVSPAAAAAGGLRADAFESGLLTFAAAVGCADHEAGGQADPAALRLSHACCSATP